MRRIVGAGIVVAVAFGFAVTTVRAKDEGPPLPAPVLELLKATKTGGEFALEVDASGRIVALEAEIPVSALPKAAIDAAAAAFPGSKAVGAEREWIAGAAYWEVVLDLGGKRVEFLVREDGTEGGREEVIAAADVPKAIRDAADRAVPGGTLEVVEKVSGAEAGGRGTEYHVKKRVDGELQRISVAPDGTVPLVLRKIRAEMKIPR
jgi:hypothetical protein